VARDATGKPALVEAYYQIDVDLEAGPSLPAIEQTGIVILETPPRSRLANLLRYVRTLLMRESGF